MDIVIHKRYRCVKANCSICGKELFIQVGRYNRVKVLVCKSCTLARRNKENASINCKNCGILLDENTEVRFGKRKTKVSSLCISCFKDDEKRKRKEIKKKVIEHYGGKCACCGETIPEFLCVDHINNDGNKHRKELNIVGTNMYASLVRNNFNIGYELQLLCWNCNLAKQYYGICPHQETKI